MLKKIILVVILFFVFSAVSGLIYFQNIRAQDSALTEEIEVEIIEKLEKIMDNQKEILKQLESVRQEIKARCR